MSVRISWWCLGAVFVVLAACSGANPSGGAVPGTKGDVSFSGVDDFFAQRVQPRLEFCRTCHVPGGVADTDAGHLMMLSSDKSQDLANLTTSWNAMGGNNPVSKILLMASGQQSHSGGSPWPQGSDAYKDVAAMLACLEKPGECSNILAGLGGGG